MIDPLKSTARIMVRHPWSSLQDALLLTGGMLVAFVLALEYDLLRFGEQLTSAERKITLSELLLLSGLLAMGIFGFIVRRLQEGRRDLAERSERHHEIETLREQANNDPLTGLLNRRGMLSALASATTGPLNDGRRHAFYLLDLNNFKRVNDRYGHAVGDQVLKVVVERFKAAGRPSDVLGRLGGDEFAVLAYDVDRESAHAVGERYIATLHNEISAGATVHKVGVSIGGTFIPDDGVTSEEILANADVAMYAAKEQQESALVFYASATGRPDKLQQAWLG